MTCGAESNQAETRYIEEDSAGVAPATGDMQIMRNVGVGGGVDKTTTISEEIRDDRQISDSIMTKKAASKDINGEFSFGTWDAFLKASLFTTWSNIHYRSDDISVELSNIYQLPTDHGLNFLPGHLLRVAGYDEAANNGEKIVTDLTVNNITVAETLVAEAAGDKVTIDVIGYASSDIEVLAGNIYELPSGHGLTFIAGQSIRVAGFTTAANNGIKTVAAFSGDLITVEETLVIEAAGDDVVFKYDYIANSVDKTTFTIEDDFTDVSKVRTQTGMTVDTFALDMQKESKITVAVNFIGQNTTVGNSGEVAGTPIEPNDNEIMNTGDHIPAAFIKEDGVIIGRIEGMSIEMANNLRGLGEVGAIENTCVASGQFNLTGNLNIYFMDWDIYQKFLDNTASSFQFNLEDSNGTYAVNIPKIKFGDEEVNAGGPNADVMANGSFQAIRDPVTGLTIIITKMVV